jgi:hypothetical protein
MAQKEQALESITLGHMRSHGCRDLIVYCRSEPRLGDFDLQLCDFLSQLAAFHGGAEDAEAVAKTRANRQT